MQERTSNFFRGKPKSKIQRQRMSLAAKGRVMSEETKAKLRIANSGKHHSLESRQKMSRARKGKTFNQQHRDRISKNNCMHGHSVTDYMTPDEVIAYRKKMKCMGESMHGRKMMHHPALKVQKYVNKDQIQHYLDLGFQFGYLKN